MANRELVDYIKSTLAKGYEVPPLRDFLIKKGFASQDVDEAIDIAQKENPMPGYTPQPQAPPAEPQERPSLGVGIKKRNPVLVLVFSLITFGIYAIYWMFATADELRKNTQSAPSMLLNILLFVPFVNFVAVFIFYWKYSKAVHELTNFDSTALFLLFILVSPVGMVIAQSELNKKADH